MSNTRVLQLVMYTCAVIFVFCSKANCTLYKYDDFSSPAISDSLWTRDAKSPGSVLFDQGQAILNMGCNASPKRARMILNHLHPVLESASDCVHITWEQQISSDAEYGYLNGLCIRNNNGVYLMRAGQMANAGSAGFAHKFCLNGCYSVQYSDLPFGIAKYHYDLTITHASQTLRVFAYNPAYDNTPESYDSPIAAITQSCIIPINMPLTIIFFAQTPWGDDCSNNARATVNVDNVYCNFQRPLYSVWTENSLHKVLQTDPVNQLDSANISAAKNEHEAFQIVLRAGDVPLDNVDVSVSDLVSASSRIPASNVNIYLPAYMYITGANKEYPDPLPPYTSPFTLEANRTQPLWVDVYVPSNATPGDYSGEITVRPSNTGATVVPFTVHVYAFTLPVESKLNASFGCQMVWGFAEKNGVQAGSTEEKNLQKKYWEMLLQNGISPYDDKGYGLPVDIMSVEATSYLIDARMTSFNITFTWDSILQKRIIARAKSLGVWNKAYFYCVDEPGDTDACNGAKSVATYLHSIDPTAKLIVPYSKIIPSGSTQTIYDILSGYVDIWCCYTESFDPIALAACRNAGNQVWTYVCCAPGLPYANYIIEYPPILNRIIAWQNYLYSSTGILYWSTTNWPTTDPWTIPTEWGGRHGDGTLLYPGKKVGIDGPVSSIRLEIIRDSLEDYKYLWLLEQKVGRDVTLSYVNRLTSSWTTCNQNCDTFEQVRDEIARRIEE